MKKRNSYISLFISLLICSGMFLSVVHNHGHDDHSADNLVHQITQDIAECAICASHFKFSSDTVLTSLSFLSAEVIDQTIAVSPIIDPAGKSQPGRAPPSKG